MSDVREIKLTDIKGIRVGHAQNEAGGTGCTAIICDNGVTASVDVRGGVAHRGAFEGAARAGPFQRL